MPANVDLMDYNVIELKTSKQTLTGSFADLGDEIPCLGYRSVQVYLELDINDGTNITIGALGKLVSGSTNEYWLPEQVDGTAKVAVDKLVHEINYDADGFQMFRIDVTGVPFLQLQAKDTCAEGTHGDIEHVTVVLTR